MKGRTVTLILAILLAASLAAGCAQQAATTEARPTEAPTEPPPPTEVEVSGSVTDGGKLYDKWWKAAGVDEPAGDQPLWASQTTNERSGTATWRCKECHGWDYKGADGAYGSGSHFTGFPGVFDAQGMSDGELLAWLDGSTNADHDFSAMGEEALGSMVTFLQEGLIDLSEYIDYDAKVPLEADAEHGEELFNSVCAACHGADGRQINFGSDEEPEFIGTVASGNPWEATHKVRNGQPGEAMPAALDSGWSMQDVMDVIAYQQTLPAELPPAGVSLSRGGRLYDKWWVAAGVDEPSGDMPVWARQDSNTRSGADTWRCKECHGWDYMGADGAYGSGSHFTGFPGVFAAQEKTVEELVAQMSGANDPEHDFSAMGESAINDLASFIKEGLVDLTAFIDYDTKAPIGGDSAHGEELFDTTCEACHGEDGRMINFGDADDPEFVGTVAGGNPWEFIHKVRAGQPGTGMPSAIDNGWDMQNVIDVLTYAQTLPVEAP